MESNPGNRDWLRYVANSEIEVPGKPSIPEMKILLKPKYPWIFDSSLESGKLEDHFTVADPKLSSDGFHAKVLFGVDKSTGMKVACKKFPRTVGELVFDNKIDEPEFSFLRELYFLTLVPEGDSYPKLYGAFVTETELILVISCHGKNLQSAISSNPQSVSNIKLYTKEIVRLLSDLIDAGIWHCDPKPSNLLFGATDDRLVMVDYGFAFGSGELVEIVFPYWISTHMGPELNILGKFLPEKLMVWTLGDNVYRMMTCTNFTNHLLHLTPDQKKEVFAKEYQINQDWPEEIREFLQAAFQPEDSRPTLKELLSLKLLQ